MKGRYSSVGDVVPSSTALLGAYIPGLRRFARGLVRGDQDRADDLVQDCLERALSHWRKRQHDKSLRSWVYTILYNGFVTDQQRRKQRASHSTDTEASEEDLPGIDGGQEGTLVFRDFRRGFAKLPADQQAVLFLIGVEDFTYAEAAHILGVPIGTVMSRLSRGRERLRRYINEDLTPTRPQRYAPVMSTRTWEPDRPIPIREQVSFKVGTGRK
jgi:RNA polymerase sigma-70 factor (ECF subfamily)